MQKKRQKLNLFLLRVAQKQLDTLKLKLKESIDKEKLLPKITEQAKKLRNATQDEKDILGRMKDRERERLRSIAPLDKNARQDDETQRDYLVRTGKITPFDHLPEAATPSRTTSRKYDTEATSNSIFPGSGHNNMSHKNLHAPSHKAAAVVTSKASQQKQKRKRKLADEDEDDDFNDEEQAADEDEEDEFRLDNDEEEEDGSIVLDSGDGDLLKTDAKKRHTVKKLDEIYNDDGSELNYKKRLNDWVHNRKIMRYQVTHVNFI